MRARESTKFLTRDARATLLVDLPAGLTIQGALAIYHLLWGNANGDYTLQTFYGYRKARANPLSCDAKLLSERVFTNLTGRQVLERHTLFGFYSNTLDPAAADAWAGELLRGNSSSFLRYLPLQDGATLVDPTRRHCTDCVAEDKELHGFAIWRLVHHVPGIRYCWKHKRPLLHRCEACGNPLVHPQSLSLPGQGCEYCKAKPRRLQVPEVKPGPLDLALHAELLAQGELQALRPTSWGPLVRSFVDDHESSQVAAQALSTELEQSWPRHDSPASRVQAIERELLLLGLSGNVVQRLVILGALVRLGYDIHAARPALIPLEALAARHCVPLGSVGMMRMGMTRSAVSKATLVPISRLQIMIDAIPPGLRDEVPGAYAERVIPKLQLKRGATTDAVKRDAYRRVIVWALNHWKQPGRADLWKHLPRQMMWLNRYDKPWLKSILPSKIVRGTKLFGSRKVSQQRTRWCEPAKPKDR